MDKDCERIADIKILLSVVKSLLSYLPCNVQRGSEWIWAWDLLGEDDRNGIIEEAAIASDIYDEMVSKYKVGGGDEN